MGLSCFSVSEFGWCNFFFNWFWCRSYLISKTGVLVQRLSTPKTRCEDDENEPDFPDFVEFSTRKKATKTVKTGVFSTSRHRPPFPCQEGFTIDIVETVRQAASSNSSNSMTGRCLRPSSSDIFSFRSGIFDFATTFVVSDGGTLE